VVGTILDSDRAGCWSFAVLPSQRTTFRMMGQCAQGCFESVQPAERRLRRATSGVLIRIRQIFSGQTLDKYTMAHVSGETDGDRRTRSNASSNGRPGSPK
jgi:hypothetical protein